MPAWRKGLRLGRRDMMALCAALPMFAVGRSANSAPLSNEATLNALVETLLPGDIRSPSGLDTNIPERLLGLAETIPNYRDMLTLGLQWINDWTLRDSGVVFAEAAPSKRDDALKAALAEQPGTLPPVFAARVRNDAMTLYYASPVAWASLGFDGPIQPVGFPDHSAAPHE